jgi:hypothetical protein
VKAQSPEALHRRSKGLSLVRLASLDGDIASLQVDRIPWAQRSAEHLRIDEPGILGRSMNTTSRHNQNGPAHPHYTIISRKRSPHGERATERRKKEPGLLKSRP